MRQLMLLGLALFTICGNSYAQTLPPVEAFGRLPEISSASISPSGERVALALSDAQGRGSVAIVEIDRLEAAQSFGVAEGEQLRAVDWADDRHVFYMVSRTFRPGQVLPPGVFFRGNPQRVDYWRTGVIDADTGRIEVILTNERYPWADAGSSLIAPVEGDPGFGRLIGSERGEIRMWRVNLANGRVSPATPRGSN